ncbi:acetyltransferase [Nisaea acidiphila]|uniref:Acetyltransferase n=1 Tax=Nisaea acidiphila TaxID=1862145 RepID=A0A9J7AN26_9PROT|nr:acetyltransferase [Nisaea acidiphila]UUX48354.1 acetyltransferase [Nisaea acidiphila]
MSRAPVHIVGCGGHAKVIAAMIEGGTRYEVASFVDRDARAEATFLDRPVIGENAFLAAGSGEAVVVGLGEWLRRKDAVARLRAAGWTDFPAVIDPSAVVAADVQVGEGAVLMPGTVVNPGTEIGAFCVLNTGAVLDHDCSMADGSALAPGVTVGGGCRIGAGAYLGIGASLAHGCSVGNGAVLGGGGFLMQDAGPGEFWAGVPATFVRKRAADETVL